GKDNEAYGRKGHYGRNFLVFQLPDKSMQTFFGIKHHCQHTACHYADHFFAQDKVDTDRINHQSRNLSGNTHRSFIGILDFSNIGNHHKRYNRNRKKRNDVWILKDFRKKPSKSTQQSNQRKSPDARHTVVDGFTLKPDENSYSKGNPKRNKGFVIH